MNRALDKSHLRDILCMHAYKTKAASYLPVETCSHLKQLEHNSQERTSLAIVVIQFSLYSFRLTMNPHRLAIPNYSYASSNLNNTHLIMFTVVAT